MIDQADLDWWLALAPELEWTFAKTMPNAPHSYVVKGKALNDEDFERAVRVIRTFGEPGKFYSNTQIYLTHENRKWWTMGAPIEETIIINTATTDKTYGTQNAPSTRNDDFTVYDALATEYDQRYKTPEALAEDRQAYKLITEFYPNSHPLTLDVGCGTGLALDLSITSPKMLVGVDPSQGMLNELVRKHPDVRAIYPHRFEEVAHRLPEPKFQLVLSLFGSPSYLTPGAIRLLPEIASEIVVMMHYEKGYLPDYHQSVPDTLDTSREAAKNLLEKYDGRTGKIGRFDVTVLDLRRH